jgi:hypothetical protein
MAAHDAARLPSLARANSSRRFRMMTLLCFGQRQRIFDGGVTGADHDDGLARVFIRVVELVLHEGQVCRRSLPACAVALQADAQHHVLGATCRRRP